MKTLFKFLPIAFLGFCFILNSCSEVNENPVQDFNSKNLMNNQNLSPGQIHNYGLEALFNSVIRHSDFPDVELTLSTLNDSGRHYLINEANLNLSNSELDLYTASLNYHQVGVTPDISMASVELQIEIQELFKHLDEVIDDTNIEAGQDIFDYSRYLLDGGAPSNLSESDQLIWSGAVDLMGYTAFYWYENAEKWEAGSSNGTSVA